jgi:6-phosphogluconate dehydrogenase
VRAISSRWCTTGAHAEGFGILRHANIGAQSRPIDAETAPLRHPEHYQYDLNLPDIAEVWRRESVIASWLLDLLAAARLSDPTLGTFAGRVSDSGEGRWTIKGSDRRGRAGPCSWHGAQQSLQLAGHPEFQNKLLSSMRYSFGGHVEQR